MYLRCICIIKNEVKLLQFFKLKDKTVFKETICLKSQMRSLNETLKIYYI